MKLLQNLEYEFHIYQKHEMGFKRFFVFWGISYGNFMQTIGPQLTWSI